MTENINRLEWERFVLGELPPDRARELADRLAGDPRLGLEIEEIKRSNSEDLDRYPAARVVPQIRERVVREAAGSAESESAAPSRRRKRFLLLAPTLAAAALLAMILFPSLKNSLFRGIDEETIKGTAGAGYNQTQILVFRKRGPAVEEMADGSAARAGDLLQLAYVSTDKFGVIISLDGTGTISLHWPETEGAAAPLETGQRILLPRAIELDAAPGFERIFLVTSEEPFEISIVRIAVATLSRDADRAGQGELILPRGLHQTSFLIRK